MKWVFFIRELLKPVRVEPGKMYSLEDSEYADLRAQAGDDFVLNITPLETPRSLAQWFGQTLHPKPESGAFLVPCPVCMNMDQRGIWYISKPMTVCETCKDARSIVGFSVMPSESAKRKYQEHISTLVRNILNDPRSASFIANR